MSQNKIFIKYWLLGRDSTTFWSFTQHLEKLRVYLLSKGIYVQKNLDLHRWSCDVGLNKVNLCSLFRGGGALDTLAFRVFFFFFECWDGVFVASLLPLSIPSPPPFPNRDLSHKSSFLSRHFFQWWPFFLLFSLQAYESRAIGSYFICSTSLENMQIYHNGRFALIFYKYRTIA